MLSALKMDASLIAFHDRYRPVGSRIYDDMNTPRTGPTAPSLASFSPEMSMTQYATKKSTDMIAETPSPHLRMIAPRGAPMKKKIRHAKAMANFLRI